MDGKLRQAGASFRCGIALNSIGNIDLDMVAVLECSDLPENSKQES
jgi:hypothetical protein